MRYSLAQLGDWRASQNCTATRRSVRWEWVERELFKSTDDRCGEKTGIRVLESQSTCRPIFGFSNIISNLKITLNTVFQTCQDVRDG